MPQIGPAEILVVLLVGLLVFGPKRLPEIGRQVGRGMRELRKFQDTVRGELDEVLHLHEHDAEVAVDDAPPVGAAAVSTPPIDVPGETSMPPPLTAGPPGPTSATPTTPAVPTTPTAPTAPHAPSRAPSRFRPPGPRPTT